MGIEFCQKPSVHLLRWLYYFSFFNLLMQRYHPDWFTDVEKSLPAWNISHLIIISDPFQVLWNCVCQYFVEDFCVCNLCVCVCVCVMVYLVLLSGWHPDRFKAISLWSLFAFTWMLLILIINLYTLDHLSSLSKSKSVSCSAVSNS